MTEDYAVTIADSINPAAQFPIPADEIWRQSKQIKTGAQCTVVWTFVRQKELNISNGKVIRTYSKRGGLGKLTIAYTGYRGYRRGEEFKGFLPPQDCVRVYRIWWHQPPPAIDDIVLRDSFLENQEIPLSTPPDSEGIDRLPIPTMRAIGPEFAPCVISLLRNIVQNYSTADYETRSGTACCRL